ncbi:hypothetical protein [Halomonas binhaiensis]|uniref:Uncharacterized protein n=1 Tax=Halomonas binhaiensis TaxID=2562282 RepID=A0A5C1NIX6_9GAMM|nr:hypothetical protein [Halomonas binhaiensis]QEM82035.1 hypothetical protein E4T21_11075 [Halomonas binhaiensis]
MGAIAQHIDTDPRIDLARFANALYRLGGVLEMLTDMHFGLDANTVGAMTQDSQGSARLRRLLNSGTVAYSPKGRLILSQEGRELAFDMFGVGACD